MTTQNYDDSDSVSSQPEPRWYCLNRFGAATLLCADQADAVETALDADIAFPSRAPHRAVQMVELLRKDASNERLRDLDCPHCGGSGHVDDVQTAVAVDAAQYRQPDGWLQDGSLLYRLTDERQPQNRDEINVTMAGGSRDERDRAAMASALLGMTRERAAAARLIAAAPDLLAALDEAYGELLADSHRDGPRCLLLTTIEEALAKARGQHD